MADETAKVSVIIDASGAKTGADQVVASTEKVIAAEEKVTKSRAKSSKAAKDSSDAVIAAAKAAADAVVTSNTRTEQSNSKQAATLDRLAKQWDPLLGALGRAQRQFEAVADIAAKTTGPIQVQSLNMVAEAWGRVVTAQNNLSGGYDVAARTEQLRTTFDKAGTSARLMAKELNDLNDALKLGVNIDRGYANAQLDIIEKYDEGAMAAKRLREAQAELVASAPGASLAALSAVIDQTNSEFVSATTQALKYADALERIEIASSLGTLNPVEAQTERGRAAAKYDPATIAAADQTKQAAVATAALSKEMDRLDAKYPTITSQTIRYADELRDVEAATKLLNLSQQQSTELRAQAAASFDPVTIAANKAAKDTVTAQQTLAATMDRLEGEFRPAAAAAKQYASALQDLDVAAHLLDLTAEETAAAQARLRAAFTGTGPALQNHTQSAFAARFATQQLGVQTIQFFSSLEAGQPFMMAFIGQAHQVVDVAIATGTGFKVLGQGIASFFTAIGRWVVNNPIVSAIGAATAAMVTLGIMAETAQRRLEGVKNVLSGVRSDFAAATQASETLAKTLAATTALTTAQSRDASTTLFQGGFAGTTEEGTKIIKMFADLSKVVKETEPNFHRMAEAMKDPAKVMQELLDANPLLAGFDQNLVNTAKRYMELGKSAEAAAILMQAIATATKHVTDNQTPLEKALRGLSEEFNKAWIAGKSFAEVLGEGISNAAAKAVNALTAVISSTKAAIAEFNSWPEWVKILAKAAATAVNPAAGLAFGGVTSVATPSAAVIATARQQELLAAPGAVTTMLGDQTRFGRAIGTMQLLPGTAEQMKVNPYIPNENVQGGMKYLQGLVTQFQRTPIGSLSPAEAATRAYNVGPAGALEGGDADKYAGQIARADIGKLPTDTASMIDYWGKFYNMSPQMIEIGKRIAMVESGGHQGPTRASQAFVAPGMTGIQLPAMPAGPGAPGSAGPLPVLPQIDALRKAIADAEAYDGSLKRVTDTTAKLHATEDALKAAIIEKSKLAAAGDTAAGEAAKRYQYDLVAVQGELYRNLTPQQEMLKGLQETANAAQVLTEGDRQLFEVRQQLNELNRQHPETANVAVDAEIVSAKLAQLSGDYKKLLNDGENQIKLQNNLTEAYGKSYLAVVEATAANQAYAESLKLPAGPMREAAQAGLTAQNIRQTRAAQETAAKQQSLTNQDTLQYIKAESDSLADNSDVRTINLARLKAEQEAKQKLSALSPALQAAYVKEAEQIAKGSLNLARETQAIQTVAGTFSSAFDTISNSITDALVKGQGAAVNWKNVMLAVAQQIISQFLKLAFINPMLNALFPGAGHGTTLFEAFDALNKTKSGSSSTEAGGGGVGGILGAIASIFTKGAGTAGAGFSGVGSTATSAISAGTFAPGLPDFGTLTPQYHSGGIVGANDNMPGRLVHSAMFANAPRFHSGSSGDLTAVLTRATDIMARRAGMQGLQPGEMPAVLMRNERVLTEQQDGALRMMIAGMTDQLAMFKGTGTDGHRFTPSLPRFHGGSGGGEFSSIMARGQQALSSAPVAVAPGGTDNVNINIDARGSTAESVNTFRRSMPQIATTMSEQLARARARNG